MKALILFLVLIPGLVGQAQEKVYAVPSLNLLNINPSFAGSSGGLRLQAAGSGIDMSNVGPGTYTLYNGYFSADTYLNKIKGGLGLSYNISNGPQNTFNQNVSAVYAQHIGFFKNELKLVPSVKVDYYNNYFYWTNYWGVASPPVNYYYGRAGAGLLLSYRGLYAGFYGASAFVYSNNVKGTSAYAKSLIRTYVSQNVKIGEAFGFNLSALFGNYYYVNYWPPVQSFQLALDIKIFKHFTIGAGFMEDHNYFMSAGFKNKYVNTRLVYIPTNRLKNHDGGIYMNEVQVAASTTLCKKERAVTPRDFETW